MQVSLNNYIKNYRINVRRCSQEDAARYAGVNIRTYQTWEYGEKIPSEINLANFFNKDQGSLIEVLRLRDEAVKERKKNDVRNMRRDATTCKSSFESATEGVIEKGYTSPVFDPVGEICKNTVENLKNVGDFQVSRISDNDNILMIGSSGSGKESVLRDKILKSNNNAIIFDTCGSLYRPLSYDLKDADVNIVHVDISDYNCFLDINDEIDAVKIADIICRTNDNHKEDLYWKQVRLDCIVEMLMMLHIIYSAANEPLVCSDMYSYVTKTLRDPMTQTLSSCGSKVKKMLSPSTLETSLYDAYLNIALYIQGKNRDKEFTSREIRTYFEDDRRTLVFIGVNGEPKNMLKASLFVFNYINTKIKEHLDNTIVLGKPEGKINKPIIPDIHFTKTPVSNTDMYISCFRDMDIPDLSQIISVSRSYQINYTLCVDTIDQIKSLYPIDWYVLLDLMGEIDCLRNPEKTGFYDDLYIKNRLSLSPKQYKKMAKEINKISLDKMLIIKNQGATIVDKPW